MGKCHIEELLPSTIIRKRFYEREGIRDMVREKNVLDIGCGTGFFTEFLGSKARFCIGTDVSYANVRHAASLNGKGNYLVSDAHFFSFKPASFDVVFLSCVMEHFYDTKRVLEEIKMVLRPKGTLILTVDIKPRLSFFLYGFANIFNFVYAKDHPQMHKAGYFSNGNWIDAGKLADYLQNEFTLLMKKKSGGTVFNIIQTAFIVTEKLHRMLFYRNQNQPNIGDHAVKLDDKLVRLYKKVVLPIIRKLLARDILLFDAVYQTMIFRKNV